MINFIQSKEPSFDYIETLNSYPWQQEGEDNPRLLSLIQSHFRAKPSGQRILGDTLHILEEKYPEEGYYAIDNLKPLVELVKV